MKDSERAKKLAAETAAQMIPDHSMVGLGTGSTLEYAIKELGRRIRDEDLKISAVTTSFQGQLLANENSIVTLNSMNVPNLNIAIDGADEVDPNGNLIKGLGAALTKEKIVAAMPQRYIIVIDETKKVTQLGEKTPVQVEVVPDALALVECFLKKLGVKPRVRPDQSKAGPVVTDLGNLIVDVEFGIVNNAESLEQQINNIPGVVSNGLFLGIVDEVIVGSVEDGQARVERRTFKKKTFKI
ncbi:MAG: ribose-5-phosphate isomerase RpiA [Sedimentisphaerales bacterium]|nr:ribose-5-phosphate isomerase RpiA [Sedimentisphaerales bacterium]